MKKRFKGFLAVISACAILVVGLPVFAVAADTDEIDAVITTDDVTAIFDQDTDIVFEVQEKREATVKHFRMSDGRYLAAQYDTPVHFLDEAGVWQEYDNRLTDAEDDSVVNQRSDVLVKLSKKAKEKKMLRVRSDGYELSWGYDAAAKVAMRVLEAETERTGNRAWTELTTTSSAVIYENIYTDTDLEVYLQGGAVKENLVLKSASASHRYTLNYEIGDLTAYQQDARTILLKASDGTTVYTVAAPCMTDSAGAYSDGITLSADTDGKKMTVTLAADSAWLLDAQRVYPIVIDPFTQTDVTPTDVESATLLSKDTASYPYDSLIVGRDTAYEQMVSVFKPTLPPLELGDMVVEAKLNLYQIGYAGTQATQVNVSRITQPWTEAGYLASSDGVIPARYINRPARDTKIDDYVTMSSSTAGWQELDITRTAQKWYRDPLSPNYGVMLWPQDADAYACVSFLRESDTNASYSAQFPTVTVIYLNTDGLENYRHYYESAATQRGTAYVNTYTGAAVVTETVFSTNGSRMPMTVSLTYNSSRYNDEFPFGDAETSATKGASVSRGFMFNFQQRVESVTDEALLTAGYKYIYTDGDGTRQYFRRTSDESTAEWTDETGQGMTLTESGGGVVIQFKDGGKYCFYGAEYGGILNYAEDTHGNRITYENTAAYADTHGRLINKITDGAGRSVTIAYTARGNHMRPNKLTDNEGRVYTFNYDTNHRLTGISYPDGSTTTYTYADGLLTEIRDSVSLKLTTYTYDIATRQNETIGIRVNYLRSFVERSSGNLALEEYYFLNTYQNFTYVTDYDARSTNYFFDKYGRVTGGMDDRNAAYHVEYAAATGTQSATKARPDVQKENKIKAQSDVTPEINNYMVNSGAERDDGYIECHWDDHSLDGLTIDNTAAYLGNRSLRIRHNQTGMYFSGHAQQVPTELMGETVTFSAYVKTDGVAPASGASSNEWGAGLMIQTYTDAGWQATEYIPYFQKWTVDWTRISMTYTIPETATQARVYVILKNATGTAWFDCLQLERSAVMNEYNLLESSDFSNAAAWSADNLTAEDRLNNRDVLINGDGDNSGGKCVYQYVTVNRQGVCFNLYGKMAGIQAAPKSGRLCALELVVHYTDGTKQTFVKNFHDVDESQQAISYTVRTDKNKVARRVGFLFMFLHNANAIRPMDGTLTIDMNGESYAYDENGNLDTVSDNSLRAEDFDFESATDQLKQYTNAEDDKYQYVYDTANPYQLNAVYSKQLNNGYAYSYDSYGNVTGVAMGEFSGGSLNTAKRTLTASATYTSNGNYVDTVTDANGIVTDYNINQHDGRLESVSTAVGTGRQAQTSYTYTSGTRLLSGVSSTATDNAVAYQYDARRRLRKITVSGSNYLNSYMFLIDNYNNPTSIHWGNTTMSSYTYADSRKGLVSAMQYGNGAVVTYGYDEWDRPISKQLQNEQPRTIAYNERGQIGRIDETADGYSTDYTYDLLGRLIRSDTHGSRRTNMRYNYDKMDRPTYTVWQVGGDAIDASYHYGEDGLTTSMYQGALYFTYQHDHLGRVTQETVGISGSGNTMANQYVYKDDTAQVESKHFVVNGSTVDSETYFYNASGELSNVGGTEYTYDLQGQLTQEYNMSLGTLVTYTYVGNGNLSAVQSYQLNKDGSRTLVSSKTYAYEFTGHPDLLTAYNGQTITYDAIGNPLTYRGGMTMTWVNGRQLSTVSNAGGTIGSYNYDADGVRLSKTVGGVTTQFYYDDLGRLICSGDGTAAIWYYYGPNDTTPQSFRSNGVQYYYIKNLRGDITGIADTNGNVIARYTYDAWGKLLSVKTATGATITDTTHLAHRNPLRYRGYFYDGETGLYYVSSRYYDPEIGRWISPEPNVYNGEFDEGAGLLAYNVYAYCANNPVMYVDSDGEGIFLAMAIGAGVGALISGAVKAYQNYKSGQKWYKGMAISMLAGGIGGAISCISIPGVSSWVCAAVFGAAGNLTTKVILGEIKSIGDLTSAIAVGAGAGLLGNAASKVLIKGVTKYFGTLTKAKQKAFLSRIGRITNAELRAIRRQVSKGLTPSVLEQFVKEYGYDVLVSAFVSSTAASTK